MARIITLSISEDTAEKLKKIAGKDDIKEIIKDAIEFFILFYEPAKEYLKKAVNEKKDGDKY